MSNKSLRVIYCKDCRFYQIKQLWADATLISCRKNSDLFDATKPEVFCNKTCYQNKIFNKVDKDGKNI